MEGRPGSGGWERDEFLIAIGILIVSTMIMWAMAKTLLITPLAQSQRQLQFYTGVEWERNRRGAQGAAGPGGRFAAAEGPAPGRRREPEPEPEPQLVQGEEPEEAGQSSDEEGDDGELATADRAELLRLIRVQRRQLETLEAVNDQLCEDHERMEQQLESVRSIVHN